MARLSKYKKLCRERVESAVVFTEALSVRFCL